MRTVTDTLTVDLIHSGEINKNRRYFVVSKVTLFHSWHIHRSFVSNSILTSPQAGYSLEGTEIRVYIVLSSLRAHLVLSIKVYAILAVVPNITKERCLEIFLQFRPVQEINLNFTLLPLQENMGKGTGIGTLMPTCPTSTWCSNLRAVAPD